MNSFLIAIGIFVVIISVAGFYNLILFKKNLNKVTPTNNKTIACKDKTRLFFESSLIT